MMLTVALLPVSLIVLYSLTSLFCALHAWRTTGRLAFAEKGLPLWCAFGDWAPRRLRILMTLRKLALLASIAFFAVLPLGGETLLLHRL